MPGDGFRDDGRIPIFGIIPVRVGAGALLLYMHAWPQGVLAWQHVWNQQAWDMIATLEAAGLTPFLGKVLGATAALLAVFASLSWILGFLTRLCSLLFIPVTLGALWVCNRSEMPYRAEAAILYFLVAVTLFINGSGWFGIDTIFRLRRERRSSSSSLYL